MVRWDEATRMDAVTRTIQGGEQMTETCKSCRLFFLYPSPKYDVGICEETRFIMAPEAPACNYYLPWKWTQEEKTDGDKGTCQNHKEEK